MGDSGNRRNDDGLPSEPPIPPPPPPPSTTSHTAWVDSPDVPDAAVASPTPKAVAVSLGIGGEADEQTERPHVRPPARSNARLSSQQERPHATRGPRAPPQFMMTDVVPDYVWSKHGVKLLIEAGTRPWVVIPWLLGQLTPEATDRIYNIGLMPHSGARAAYISLLVYGVEGSPEVEQVIAELESALPGASLTPSGTTELVVPLANHCTQLCRWGKRCTNRECAYVHTIADCNATTMPPSNTNGNALVRGAGTAAASSVRVVRTARGNGRSASVRPNAY